MKYLLNVQLQLRSLDQFVMYVDFFFGFATGDASIAYSEVDGSIDSIFYYDHSTPIQILQLRAMV